MVWQKLAQMFQPRPSRAHIQILIVDHKLSDLTITKDAVLRGGFNVITASNGSEGLQSAEDFKPDLVIIEADLPDMAGHELCGALKRRFPDHLGVIVLTRMDSPGMILDCYGQGADNYLLKPVAVKYLLKQIELLLAEYRKLVVSSLERFI